MISGAGSGWARWVGSVSDALPGGHLSLDAVVAFVDDELLPGPAQRAAAHVDRCLSCAGEVAAQRQARRRLRGASTPGAPMSLLSSLRAIPADADLPPVPATLAVDEQGRLVARAEPTRADAPRPGDPRPGAPRPDEHPAGTGAAGLVARSRRGRRRLGAGLPLVVASGLAVGAAALAGPAAAPTVPQPAGTARATTGAVAPAPTVAAADLAARRQGGAGTAPAPARTEGLPGPGAP